MIKTRKFYILIFILGFPLLLFSQNKKEAIPENILKKSNLQFQNICNQISSDNVARIVPILDSTLFVECMPDKKHGDTFIVNSEKYKSAAQSIFDLEFMQELKKVTKDQAAFKNSFMIQNGEYYFVLNVNYNKYDPNGFKDEFSRLFRFKWDGTKLALGLVFCAG
jgi:hypothetical protein